MSIACLPWYDLSETRPYTDQFWFCLVERLTEAGFGSVPTRLMREVHHDEVLEHPDLLLSQTCGYVVATDVGDLVRVVGTPWYSAPGCAESDYRSYVVVHEDNEVADLEATRGLRCVVNEPWSHSGVNALRSLVAPLHEGGVFFESVHRSGSHLHSLTRLQERQADLTCIDCVTHELVRRHRPQLLQGLRTLCTTAPAPAPPFVTSASTSPELIEALRNAVADVLADPRNSQVCEALLIAGVERLDVRSYDGMAMAAERARELGYTEMDW